SGARHSRARADRCRTRAGGAAPRRRDSRDRRADALDDARSRPARVRGARAGSDFADAIARARASGPWVEAGLALAEDRPGDAARVYAEVGAHFAEAWARLLAAESGDLAQLEPARAFFESQGAEPFVRRCEAVLAASA